MCPFLRTDPSIIRCCRSVFLAVRQVTSVYELYLFNTSFCFVCSGYDYCHYCYSSSPFIKIWPYHILEAFIDKVSDAT